MLKEKILQQAAQAGRSTDTTLAHLTFGEVVIPREMVEDPDVFQFLLSVFDAFGADIREFTVGDPANKINPETGYPEFFFKKVFKAIKKIVKKAAPIALPILGTMIPGVGPALGGALGGAVGGAVSGGGLKGALTGGLLGGAGGALTGGVSGILGKAPETIAWNQGGTTALAGSGIRGALGGGGLSSLTQGSGGGLSNLSTLARVGTSLYGGSQDDEALKKAQRAMLESQGRAESALQPYSQMGLQAQQQLSNNLASGFDPGDLTQDRGYQFRLNEGMDKLNASLASQGLGQSGGAMKALEDYRQQFAANEYQNAYDRWLAQNSQLAGVGGQGLQTAGAVGDIAMGGGNTQAALTLSQQEARNKRIAEILAGLRL